jgi:hypothetical protein
MDKEEIDKEEMDKEEWTSKLWIGALSKRSSRQCILKTVH